MMDHEMRMKGRKGVFGGSGNGMEKREFAVASWFLLQYFLIKIKKEILVIQLGHDCFGLLVVGIVLVTFFFSEVKLMLFKYGVFF